MKELIKKYANWFDNHTCQNFDTEIMLRDFANEVLKTKDGKKPSGRKTGYASEAVPGGGQMIKKLTMEESHQLAESIIGKFNRRGYISDSRKDERLLKQIIVQHFYELK
jgi:hypothetical protein